MPRIIFEDADLLVVERPAGFPTQPLPRQKDTSTCLAGMLAESHPELRSVGGSDWGAVHRLDVETSGLVVFARNQIAYDRLREDFSKNRVKKEYVAVVSGKISKGGTIAWPIGPDPKSSKRVKAYKNVREARRHKAQEAVTVYSPLLTPTLSLVRRGCTWLTITLKTGRRHQIRAHLAALGHPIVGDRLYGGAEAERLYLHASRLRFKHPGSGMAIDLTTEMSLIR